MTILRLNSFLRKKCPECYEVLPVTELDGKKVAIDISCILYSHKIRAWDHVAKQCDLNTEEPTKKDVQDKMVSTILGFAKMWQAYNVTPVFVFDGIPPIEKSVTLQKRRTRREDIDKRVTEEKLRLQATPGNTEALLRLTKGTIRPDKDDTERLKAVFTQVGIPYLCARGESERLCSMLCLEGAVSAVYSTDYDNLVYGCPLLLTGEAENLSAEGVRQFCALRAPRILAKLEMGLDAFRDMCILSGCDYNTNIPYLGVSCAYKLIKEYKTFRDIPRKDNSLDSKLLPKRVTQRDPSCIRYEVCLELLSPVPSGSLIL